MCFPIGIILGKKCVFLTFRGEENEFVSQSSWTLIHGLHVVKAAR